MTFETAYLADTRSLLPLTPADLRRLGAIARTDRQDLFRRKPDLGRTCAGRLFAVALCQGAALHFLDGTTGIKDLDVWSFYHAHRAQPYPARRRAIADFGDPRFGQTRDRPDFIGRRVDLLGRSLAVEDVADPVMVLRGYLRSQTTVSARCLAMKAVVMIEPDALLGTVVWPEPTSWSPKQTSIECRYRFRISAIVANPAKGSSS